MSEKQQSLVYEFYLNKCFYLILNLRMLMCWNSIPPNVHLPYILNFFIYRTWFIHSQLQEIYQYCIQTSTVQTSQKPVNTTITPHHLSLLYSEDNNKISFILLNSFPWVTCTLHQSRETTKLLPINYNPCIWQISNQLNSDQNLQRHCKKKNFINAC